MTGALEAHCWVHAQEHQLSCLGSCQVLAALHPPDRCLDAPGSLLGGGGLVAGAAAAASQVMCMAGARQKGRTSGAAQSGLPGLLMLMRASSRPVCGGFGALQRWMSSSATDAGDTSSQGVKVSMDAW